MEIPSTIDFQPESLANTPLFRINKINNKAVTQTQKANLVFMTMIIVITPEDTPMADTISAHKHEKTIDFSLVKRT